MSKNCTLDFQDSEVSSAELQDQQFVVRFSAGYVHRSNDQASRNDAAFVQALELVIDHPTNIQIDDGCVGRIARGSIKTGDVNLKSISIPYHASTSVELELEFSNGSVCKAQGTAVSLKPTGEMKIVEWLKC